MPRSFSDDDLDAAAAFLAGRHARHREAEPLLPADIDFRAEVEAAWRSPGASGAVSESGFLLGAPREDPVWGPNVWVELAGHAVEEPEAVRDLYAFAAQRWVEEGNTRHYVIVPAADTQLLDAWFRLGFGQQHAVALLEVPGEVAWPERVRLAQPHDVDSLVALAPLLADHQALAPVFGPGRTDWDEAGMRGKIVEDVAAGDVLVAAGDGSPVGCVYMAEAEPGLHRPRSAFLAWAAIVPEARGTGVGLALMQASLAWARSRGYDVIATDWRVTNLLSSRFWPRRGFRTTFLRLYRSIP
ncbi:MAG: GNAT family N-acetyltransferase [Gaiellaceae bacterium]